MSLPSKLGFNWCLSPSSHKGETSIPMRLGLRTSGPQETKILAWMTAGQNDPRGGHLQILEGPTEVLIQSRGVSVYSVDGKNWIFRKVRPKCSYQENLSLYLENDFAIRKSSRSLDQGCLFYPFWLISCSYSDFPGIKLIYWKAERCSPDPQNISGAPSGKLQR